MPSVCIWLPDREYEALLEMSDRTGLSRSFIMRIIFSIFQQTATERERKLLKRLIVKS